jgi:hypothetical protein
MTFEKKQINRAVDELTECLSNILKAARDQYPVRLRQLFATVKNNEVLTFIFKPYFDLKLNEDEIGFIGTGHHIKCDFVIPKNDDEEIALILRVLEVFGEHEECINDNTLSIYMQNTYDENLYLFNRNIVEPAFRKLMRKMRYKLEDINAIQSEKIEGHEITIFSVGTIYANHSQVAIGENIIQQNENIFSKLKNEIKNKIENENDREELLSYVTEMERNRNDKEIFRNYYDKFINRLGIYMTIFGPFLPFLVDYFK